MVVHGATGAFGQAGVLVALAMGAAEVVAAGGNRAVLDAFAELPRVRTVAMTGDPDIDAAAVGVVDMGLDLVGQASSASGTLAVLKALRRGGRLVLMGSMTVPLPVDYSMLIRGNKDILGAYMYPPQAPHRATELDRVQPLMPSSSATSSGERESAAPVWFSRRCATLDVPGMSRMFGERCKSQASATDIGVASRRAATAERVED